MALRNNSDRFGSVAMTLHWLVALLIVLQFVFANLAEQAEESHSLMGQLAWLARHKSVGITILGLAVLRVLWRFIDKPPPPPVNTPAWQRYAATATHVLMYFLLFSMPLSGWAMSSASHFPVSWFGLFTLPDLTPPDDAMKHKLMTVHSIQANVLMGVAGLHVLAALKHHFIDRDGVLLRMFGKVRTR